MRQMNSIGVLLLSTVLLLCPAIASGQQRSVTDAPAGADARHVEQSNVQQSNVPAQAQEAEDAVERAVRRFRIGVEGGVGLDPELIMFGAHGTFGPLFRRSIDFRPGIEFGVGELTTMFGVNLDVLYTLPGPRRGAGWAPYIGAGPNFALSHRGFETDEDVDDGRNRFYFGDTDFEGGLNFIAGARRREALFIEMKATAYGVSNVRLMVGFNF